VTPVRQKQCVQQHQQLELQIHLIDEWFTGDIARKIFQENVFTAQP
jgi:hypothetical protein